MTVCDVSDTRAALAPYGRAGIATVTVCHGVTPLMAPETVAEKVTDPGEVPYDPIG